MHPDLITTVRCHDVTPDADGLYRVETWVREDIGHGEFLNAIEDITCWQFERFARLEARAVAMRLGLDSDAVKFESKGHL